MNQTTYFKHVSEPWFTLLKVGLKKSEIRLWKGDYKDMKSGDCIVFENSNFGYKRSFAIQIKNLYFYDSFEECLEREELDECLPGIDTIEEGLKVYHSYFTKEDEYKFGVISIQF